MAVDSQGAVAILIVTGAHTDQTINGAGQVTVTTERAGQVGQQRRWQITDLPPDRLQRQAGGLCQTRGRKTVSNDHNACLRQNVALAVAYLPLLLLRLILQSGSGTPKASY